MTNAIESVTRAAAGNTEAELELSRYTEYAKLDRLYGDALESKLRQAGEMVDALVASLLIQQAERLHDPKGR